MGKLRSVFNIKVSISDTLYRLEDELLDNGEKVRHAQAKGESTDHLMGHEAYLQGKVVALVELRDSIA